MSKTANKRTYLREDLIYWRVNFIKLVIMQKGWFLNLNDQIRIKKHFYDKNNNQNQYPFFETLMTILVSVLYLVDSW